MKFDDVLKQEGYLFEEATDAAGSYEPSGSVSFPDYGYSETKIYLPAPVDELMFYTPPKKQSEGRRFDGTLKKR